MYICIYMYVYTCIYREPFVCRLLIAVSRWYHIHTWHTSFIHDSPNSNVTRLIHT